MHAHSVWFRARTRDPVVAAAQNAFSARLKGSSDVSENLKNAQAIAKAWRGAVHKMDPDRFQIETMVAPELDQKINVVDAKTACAYEFKVSGKNAWAEFYEDIVRSLSGIESVTRSCLVWCSSQNRTPFTLYPFPDTLW